MQPREQSLQSSRPPVPSVEGASDILAQYFRGVTERLRVEVDLIGNFFKEPGHVAEGSAQLLRELLRGFIPGRYGVGTGIVFDRAGNQSRRCDLIIYDRLLYPALLSAGSAHLFPVDFVYAVIDIRPRLTSESVRESLATIASVRKLDIVRDEFMLPEARDGGFSFSSYRPLPPLGMIFSFDSNVKQAQAFKDWFTPKSTDDALVYPTMVGCLDQGVLRIGEDGDVASSRVRCYTLPVMKNETDYLATVFRADSAVHEGLVHPVKQVRGNYALIDQSRVLLFFVLLLNDVLAQKRINPALRFTEHFLRGPLSSVVEI